LSRLRGHDRDPSRLGQADPLQDERVRLHRHRRPRLEPGHIGLQYLVAWTATRSSWIRDAVKAEPALVFFRGDFLDDRLRRERLTRGEVLAAVRERGIGSMDEVDAVVLETAGELSIIGTAPAPERRSTLRGVTGWS
jgi:hypothetical protein